MIEGGVIKVDKATGKPIPGSKVFRSSCPTRTPLCSPLLPPARSPLPFLSRLSKILQAALVYGQMNEPPGARARVALTGLAIAEYFRDQVRALSSRGKKFSLSFSPFSNPIAPPPLVNYSHPPFFFPLQEGQDVLLFVDNIFRFTQAGSEVSALLGRIPSAVGYQPTLATDMGLLQERITSTGVGSITSVQAVYVPADDLTDPAPATTFAHLDATTVLSRQIAELGIYPAVDPLDSTSRMLDPRVIGEVHYNTARATQKLLQDYKGLQVPPSSLFSGGKNRPFSPPRR